MITGATSGIGRAAAREFAGHRLVLAARSPATLAEVREECRAAGAPVLVVPTDVTTPDAGRPAPAADHHAGTGGPGDRELRRPGVPGDLGGPAQRGHAVRLHCPAQPVRRAGRSADAAGRAEQPAGGAARRHHLHAQPGRRIRPGGWLPKLSQVVRSVGGMGATVGSAVRRRLG
ncbi:SDR family NAD(P)-dependent oxidoreductase [Micromonospora sp. NBC_00898]|uniref:SDR family NAD(P)-dependent oxidoreductase n=1 Tax=Micromonospora sp. NBC_00898 TaxID=2975981 RepID=UPI003866CC72|nr:SDR family NAD(P)-dependent oxidoreductase [Micromonospora sp. NBC_00898]